MSKRRSSSSHNVWGNGGSVKQRNQKAHKSMSGHKNVWAQIAENMTTAAAAATQVDSVDGPEASDAEG